MKQLTLFFITIISSIAAMAQCPIPTGLAIESGSLKNTEVKLTWNASTNATAYRIRIEQSAPTNISFNYQVDIPETNIKIKKQFGNLVLVPGNVYRAQIGSSCGTSTSTIGATSQIIFTMPCKAPTGLTIGLVTANGASLTWDDGFGPAHQLRYKPTNSSTWISVAGITGTTYELTTLAAGTTYDLELSSACNTSTTTTAQLTTPQTSPNWNQVLKAVAADRGAEDVFGWSIAISGNQAVVGAHAEDHDVNGANPLNFAGSAYVFEKINGNWVQTQKLVAADRGIYDNFGFSVAISGNQLVVGAYNENNDMNGANELFSAGSAYVFEKNNGSWVQTQKLVAADRGADDNFGYSVAISDNQVVVGAYAEDHDVNGANELNFAGSAYVFEKENGSWVQTQKLVAADRGANDYFGESVAISDNQVVVGAHAEDHDVNGANALNFAGSAYVFEKINGNWGQTQKIVAADRGANDQFGNCVAISGNQLVVGAKGESHDVNGDNALNFAGSAYVFEKENGSWIQTQKIVASDRGVDDYFGNSVAISGNHLVVGAWHENHDVNGANALNFAGSAYVFEKINGSWGQTQKLVAADRGTGDYFGNSVSISGNQLAVGAFGEDHDVNGDNALSYAGSAYFFSGGCDFLQEAVAVSCGNPSDIRIPLVYQGSGSAISVEFTFNYDANVLSYTHAVLGIGAASNEFAVQVTGAGPGLLKCAIYLKANASVTASLQPGTLVELVFSMPTPQLNTPTAYNFLQLRTGSLLGGLENQCISGIGSVTLTDLNTNDFNVNLAMVGSSLSSFVINTGTTTITEVDANCAAVGTPVTAINGKATFTLSNPSTAYIHAERDIANSTPVINAINATDILAVVNMVTGVTANPAASALLAADVDQDGIVSALDASLIAWRSSLVLEEFPHGKDWVWLSKKAYTTNYNTATITSVPTPTACLEVASNTNSTCSAQEVTLFGVLLGDVNGSWQNNNSASNLRTSSTPITVAFALENMKTVTPNTFKIPVTFASEEAINNFSFDIDYDESQLKIQSIEANEAISGIEYYWNDYQQQRLFGGAYSLTTLGDADTVLYITVEKQGVPTLADLGTSIAYINDNPIRFGNITSTSTDKGTSDKVASGIKIYPVPTSDFITITSKEALPSTVTLTDYLGRVIQTITIAAKSSEVSVDLGNLQKGLYLMMIGSDVVKVVKN